MTSTLARLSYLALALRDFQAVAALLSEVLGLPRLDDELGIGE